MVHRELSRVLRESAARNPAVTLTGPRQSGKTTLCREVFPDHGYHNLELPDVRELATRDPRAFLGQLEARVILDEIQRAPDLLSYLQVEIDERPEPGRFILTGSQHLGLHQAVSQSLAGRTALLQLLPLSLDEIRGFGDPGRDPWTVVLRGGYAPIHQRGLRPSEWLTDYVQTYVERDARSLLNVGDLRAFQTFLELCAGRVGQLLNLSALAGDAGISQPTAKAWLSVLETSFIVHQLRPFHANLRKRLVKTPKLHFHDSGLVCALLGIDDADTLRRHPLRGSIFETWVVSEIVKAHFNRGVRPRLFHYRDSTQLEIDLVCERVPTLTAVEIKSGQTVAGDFFAPLGEFRRLVADDSTQVHGLIVYGGDTAQTRDVASVVPWLEIGAVDFGLA